METVNPHSVPVPMAGCVSPHRPQSEQQHQRRERLRRTTPYFRKALPPGIRSSWMRYVVTSCIWELRRGKVFRRSPVLIENRQVYSVYIRRLVVLWMFSGANAKRRGLRVLHDLPCVCRSCPGAASAMMLVDTVEGVELLVGEMLSRRWWESLVRQHPLPFSTSHPGPSQHALFQGPPAPLPS